MLFGRVRHFSLNDIINSMEYVLLRSYSSSISCCLRFSFSTSIVFEYGF